MTTDAPAAVPTTEQPSIAQRAVTEARELIAARPSTEAGGDDAGTKPPETAKPPEAEKPAAKPDPAEPDWSNAEARQAHLAKIKADHEADIDRRLKDQRNTFQRDLELATATKRKTELRTELDALKRANPEAYADRISTDREAIELVAEQMDSIPDEAKQRFVVGAMTTFAEQAFTVNPALRELASQPDSDGWKEASDPEKGGLFGYIHRAALDEGKRIGVEEFKKSKEFQDAISAASRRAAHDVASTVATNGPPSDDTTGGAGEGVPNFGDDLAKAAVASATRDRPGGPRYDLSRIRDPRQRTSARA